MTDQSFSKCPDANVLAAYLEDSLDAGDKRWVESHIRNCQKCNQVVNYELSRQKARADLVVSQQSDDRFDQLGQKLMPFGQLSTGNTIGRYIIIKPLGIGGMGEVYSAYDPELNRRVALKLLRTDIYAESKIKENISRLMKEAQAMAQLSHPNVISIYDVLKVDDQVVIAMEYFSGGTLKSWLGEQPRSWREILDAFMAAGQGLAAAHAAKLVHRDFKPSNVLLDENGRVCVTDFGLVRGLDQEETRQPNESLAFGHRLEESLTKTGAYIGTPAYMSPEQMLGEKSDTRSDQFCFCVALFEALVGQRPYQGETLEEIREAIFSGKIVSIDSIGIPAWVFDSVKKGLEVNPGDRYPSMEDLLEELNHDPEEEKRKKRALRNRRLGWISIILLSVVLPVGVWYGMRYRTVQLCQSAEGEFTAIWDDATKESVSKAFLAIGNPYAQATWERVSKTFDKYLSDWALMRSAACKARHLMGTESEELFDLRMSCLKKRKQELKALSAVFSKADSGVVRQAVKASSSLTTIELCADEKSLRAPYPPPKTEEAKKSLVLIQEKLAEVEALDKTGKYQQGLELLEKLNEEVNALDYKPIQAESLYRKGRLLEKLGAYKKAEITLYRSSQMAGECGYGLLAAEGLSKLVWVIGKQQARFQEGLLLGKAAEILLNVAGGRDETLAEILIYLGAIFYAQRKYDKALNHYHRALAILKNAVGPDHFNVAVTLTNLGEVFRMKGKYDKALNHYHRALAIYENTVGPDHPSVAIALNNVAGVFLQQGLYDKASEYLRKSLVIKEESLGPEHPGVAEGLLNLGMAFDFQGKFNKALEYYHRALAIFEKKLGPKHPLVGMTLNNLAVVYEEQGKYEESLEYYRKTLAVDEQTLGPDHPDLAFSLSGVGGVLTVLGKPKRAILPLERVTAICKKKTCETEPHGNGLFVLAKALVLAGGDRGRAIKLAKEARELYGTNPKQFKKKLKEVNAWLKKHDRKKLP